MIRNSCSRKILYRSRSLLWCYSRIKTDKMVFSR